MTLLHGWIAKRPEDDELTEGTWEFETVEDEIAFFNAHPEFVLGSYVETGDVT